MQDVERDSQNLKKVVEDQAQKIRTEKANKEAKEKTTKNEKNKLIMEQREQERALKRQYSPIPPSLELGSP